MRLPIDVADLVKSGSQIQKEREKTVRIAVFVEADAPNELVDAVRTALRPHTANAKLHIEVAEPGTRLIVDPASDAVVGVCGSCGTSLADSLAEARERAVPVVAIALSGDPAVTADALAHPYRDTLTDIDPRRLIEVDLGDWLTERVQGKRLALAANFAFMRRAVAVEAVRSTAFQNAVIGAVVFIPGADMPLMTANQAKMVLQIAAAYGERVGTERARELLAVVGGGFALRTVARQVVGVIPGFGWAVKGGIGYTGTIAMGYAAIKYFEGEVDVEGLRRRIDAVRAEVSARLRSISRREARRLAAAPDGDTAAKAPGLREPAALPSDAGETLHGE